MRILHLMAGLGAASGVANIARRFARLQRERGDEAVLLAPARVWNPIYFGFRFVLEAWKQARTADEIWVHCSWTFPVWYGAFLARRGWGKEVVSGGHPPKLVVVPEGSFDPRRIHNHARWKKRFVAPFDRWVLRRADEVLALCPDEVRWVRDFEPAACVRLEKVPLFLRREGVSPTQNRRVGVSPTQNKELAFADDEARRLVYGGGRALHVLFLGRAEDPLKGVRFLEAAVREINGEATTLSSRDRNVASPLELRVVCDHFGEELERDWDWCDVLCLPTLSDNFGLVVAEALEREKRVITTDGASAWDPDAVAKGDATFLSREKDDHHSPAFNSNLTYLRGYRDGTDEERMKLLKDALCLAIE